MRVVYRAQDTRLERPVALKFLSEEFTRDPLAMERLLREAKAASSLHHQNIRTIFSFDEYGGRQFIVMELLDGRPLDRVISAGPLPADTLLAFATRIADALDVAHRRGILNRAPAPQGSLNAALPAAIDSIIFRALQKDPALRYQSAAEMRADLQGVREALESGADFRVAVPTRQPGGSTPVAWRPTSRAAAVAPVGAIPASGAAPSWRRQSLSPW